MDKALDPHTHKEPTLKLLIKTASSGPCIYLQGRIIGGKEPASFANNTYVGEIRTEDLLSALKDIGAI